MIFLKHSGLLYFRASLIKNRRTKDCVEGKDFHRKPFTINLMATTNTLQNEVLLREIESLEVVI